MPRPRMIVIAGPPGSGKTTVFPPGSLGIDAFNIDDRCAQLVGSYQSIPRQIRAAVARECEHFVIRHINEGRSFAVETTLRTLASVRQAALAAKRGFQTEMRFIATASPEVNLARVIQRAQGGGHSASDAEVRDIYGESLKNIAEAIRVFEYCTLYDATEPWVYPRVVALSVQGRVELHADSPKWVEDALGLRH